MTYLVRMVTPMKREFGRTLDVRQFLVDRPYATEVIHEALQSKDERLIGYAQYVQSTIFGPRSNPSSSGQALVASSEPESSSVEREERSEKLKAKVLDKYKSGLR